MKGTEVVERQTKTGKPRSVSLDTDTTAVLQRQSQQQLDDAAEWEAAWIGDGHVFARENGEPWDPNRVTKLFDQAVRAVDVPRIRLHDLRHTWATLALRAGVHPKVVQERLGHANISITMDTYSHVMPDMQESAAELVAALVDLSEDGEMWLRSQGVRMEYGLPFSAASEECLEANRTTGDTSPRFVPPVTGETVFENPLLKPSRSPATIIGRRLSGQDRTVV